MGYTPSFTPQYENGWEDLPSETSPITAEALNAYDDAIENIEEYLASDESQANLADAYDETETYAVGDYVIYGGDLYKCTTAISTAEEWNSTHWTPCLITDEMGHGGGGSNVSITPTLSTGTKIADFEIDGQTGELYAPTGGGGNANIWTGTQAELEEVFDELEEGTQINITDDEQEVVEGGTIYSEEEQVIGLWTDNKPLYQKTLIITSASIAGNTTIDITQQLSSLNIESLVATESFITCTSAGHVYKYSDESVARVSIEDDTSYGLTLTISSGTITNVTIDVTLKYTKSTDAPIDVTIGKSTMYIASSDCYSTEEKEVGCWTDGKPLYQRTLVIDNVTQTQNTTVDLATLSDIDHIQVIGATGLESGIVYAIPEFSDRIQFNVSTGKLQSTVPANAGWSNATLTITIQYTKTTDTAGSGSYTPASGKAVYYSTNEQVIGKWSNGKPLYRKCIEIASFSSNDTLIANAIFYGSFLLSNYISDVEMAFLDLNHSYLGTPSTFTRTILNAQYEADTGYFTLFTIYSRQNVPLTLVVEYTKTTD